MNRIEFLAAQLRQDEPDLPTDRARVQAAVAVILSPDPDALLLIRRAEHPGDPWSGQMGLPGGRRSPGDADLRTTAMRESAEEVGLDLTGARLLGLLDDHAPTTTMLPPILVRPFVFLLPGRSRPKLKRNAEIADASWVNLDLLLAPGVYGAYRVSAQGISMERPGYRLPQGIVWGMTERILTPALRALEIIDN